MKKDIAALLVACAALGAFWQPAQAAPFCAVTSTGRNCWYGSLLSCQRAVGTNGYCEMNQQEAGKEPGSAKFCAVAAGSTNCSYFSYDTCARVAAQTGGRCEARH
jgi:hypothetical protein